MLQDALTELLTQDPTFNRFVASISKFPEIPVLDDTKFPS
jgi:hypothetical protein